MYLFLGFWVLLSLNCTKNTLLKGLFHVFYIKLASNLIPNFFKACYHDVSPLPLFSNLFFLLFQLMRKRRSSLPVIWVSPPPLGGLNPRLPSPGKCTQVPRCDRYPWLLVQKSGLEAKWVNSKVSMASMAQQAV